MEQAIGFVIAFGAYRSTQGVLVGRWRETRRVQEMSPSTVQIWWSANALQCNGSHCFLQPIGVIVSYFSANGSQCLFPQK